MAKALLVTHADGNMSVDLALQQARQYTVSDGELLELTLRDKVYPFQVKQYFKAYSGTDVISTWTELTNEERKPWCSAGLLRPLCRFSAGRTG